MSKTPTALLLLALATPAFSQALTPEAEAALGSALQDERHAEAFYAAVLTRFDDARPFANIIKAEQHHQDMLIDLYESYGIAIPENATIAMEAPATLAEACKIGVEAEIANRDLYDAKLLPAVAAYPDITRVMQRLRDASQENHLPAFQRCANRG